MKRNNDLETCPGRRKTVLMLDGKLTEEYDKGCRGFIRFCNKKVSCQRIK